MSETRFCTNCKHSFIKDEKELKENQTEIKEYYFYCNLFSTVSNVNGELIISKCFQERLQYSGRCGEKGHFYEPKT
jgi:hypothetical protein